MTTHKSSRRQRARAASTLSAVPTAQIAPAAPVPVTDAEQLDLVDQLQRMAAAVEHLQVEIAAVEARLNASPAAPVAPRPGAGWTPSPEPQPWLVARSA